MSLYLNIRNKEFWIRVGFINNLHSWCCKTPRDKCHRSQEELVYKQTLQVGTAVIHKEAWWGFWDFLCLLRIQRERDFMVLLQNSGIPSDQKEIWQSTKALAARGVHSGPSLRALEVTGPMPLTDGQKKEVKVHVFRNSNFLDIEKS